ncbi:unnamed protein product, partial [marine sediment metagenome]
GNFLYVGLGTSPAEIAKIDLTTFTQVATLTLVAGENICEALAVDNGYLYAGTLAGLVSKIDLTTFTEVNALFFPNGIDSLLVGAAVVVVPTVSTDSATDVSPTSATLNGNLVDDGGEACGCGFEWGETEAYEHGATPPQNKTTGQTFSHSISGLLPGHTYH